MNEMVWLCEASKAIAKVATIGEAKNIKDKAAAVKLFAAKQGWSSEQRAKVAEIELRATARLGELLKEMHLKAGRPSRNGSTGEPLPTLAAMGIKDKKQSHQAQRIADIPEAERESFIAECAGNPERLTNGKLLDRARRNKQDAAKAERLHVNGAVRKRPGWDVICGDCIKQMAKQHESIARLVFADPPYNLGVDYGDGAAADSMEPEKYLGWCDDWMKQAKRLLTFDGSMWVLICEEWAGEFACLLKNNGLTIRRWIIWYETFGVNCANNFNRCSRHLFYCVKNAKYFVFNAEAVSRASDRQTKYEDKRANAGGKVWDSVWEIPRLVQNAKERLPGFPTQLPLALLRPIIGCATDPGDVIVDPFSGSATTGCAALELGRDYLGFEQNREFVAASKLRLDSV